MTASLTRFLPDFDVPARAVFEPAYRSPDFEAPTSSQTGIDLDLVRAEARAEGAEETCRALSAQHAEERQAELERHSAELAALRLELETLAAETIPSLIAARSEAIVDQIAADVAAVLAPVLDEAVHARMIENVSDEIRHALALEEAVEIRVYGPKGLLSALSVALGEKADKLVLAESDGLDIEVEIDRTRLTSRMSAWAKALSESLA